MAMTQGYIAVGIFQDPAQAHRAIEELRQAGYSEDEIGYLARVSATEPDETTGTFITNSAAEGGLMGGLIGAAVALFIPGFGPAIAGGILAAELGGIALGVAAGGLLGTLIPPAASFSASRACGLGGAGEASRAPRLPCARWSTCNSTRCTSSLAARTSPCTAASSLTRLACGKTWPISSASSLTGVAGRPADGRAAALAGGHAPRARWRRWRPAHSPHGCRPRRGDRRNAGHPARARHRE